jgi:hypothetical protein
MDRSEMMRTFKSTPLGLLASLILKSNAEQTAFSWVDSKIAQICMHDLIQ